MALTAGFNHVALVTDDLDRFVEFYRSVFEAEVLMEMAEGPVRHALIGIGGGMALHPFEFDGRSSDGEPGHPFQRGHLDHVALDVPDEETFGVLRRRLIDAGATDGTVTDFGMVRVVGYQDPDGWWGEIALWSDGEPLPYDQTRVTQEPPAPV